MSTSADLQFESDMEKQEDILYPKQDEACLSEEKVTNITNEESDLMKQVENTSECQTGSRNVIYENDGALKKISEELNQVTNEKNAALKSVKTLSAEALEKITGEKTVELQQSNFLYNSLQKDYEKLDKELKKQKEIIQKSKDHRAAVLLLEEMTKIKQEWELLGDQKMQCEGLKMQIHSMMTENFTMKNKMEEKIKKLTSQLLENFITPSNNETDFVENNTIVQDPTLITQIEVLEKELHRAREMKQSLEVQLFNSKQDIEELKIIIEKKDSAGTSLVSKWWKPSTTSINTAPANLPLSESFATVNSSISSVKTASSGLEGRESVISVNEKSASSPAQSQNILAVSATQSSTQPVTAPTAKSWWSRPAVTFSTTTTSIPPSDKIVSHGQLPVLPGDELKNAKMEIESLKFKLSQLESRSIEQDISNSDRLKRDLEAKVAELEAELKSSKDSRDSFSKSAAILEDELKRSKLDVEKLTVRLNDLERKHMYNDSKGNSDSTETRSGVLLLENKVKDIHSIDHKSKLELENSNVAEAAFEDQKAKISELYFELNKVNSIFQAKESLYVATEKDLKNNILRLNEEIDILVKQVSEKEGKVPERFTAEKIEELKSKHLIEVEKIQADLSKQIGINMDLQTNFDAQLTQVHTLQKECERIMQTAGKEGDSLKAQLKKSADDLIVAQKNLDGSKKEIEILKTQIKKDKERSDALIGGLQTQLNDLLLEKTSTERKIRAELEEKGKKEKVELENKTKKEKEDIENKIKKERAESEDRLRKEVVRLNGELDKIKKETDAFRSAKLDELSKNSTRIKQLENESLALKTETAKTIVELKTKIDDLNKQLSSQKKDVVTEEKLKKDLDEISVKYDSLSSKHDIMVQELEVSQSAFERTSKSLAESESANKKLKLKNYEIERSEQVAKAKITKIEREREERELVLNELKAKLDEAEIALDGYRKDVNSTAALSKTKIEQLEIQVEEFKKNNAELTAKCSNIEKEFKIAERKSAQIVKDLQKQLSKVNRGGINEDASEAASFNNNIEKKQVMSKQSSVSVLNITGEHHPKLEKLTGDFMNMAQESELLNRRLIQCQEDLKATTEKVNKLQEDVDMKSKVIQQYILRDNQAKLQPDDPPKVTMGFKVNMSMLSSASTMQKLDPAILAQINIKMQKLLEELTTKITILEKAATIKSQ